MYDAGYSILDAGFWMLDTRKKFYRRDRIPATRLARKRGDKEGAEKVETVLNFEFLVLSCGIRRWRMADFVIVFMAHNTLSKGELRLALPQV